MGIEGTGFYYIVQCIQYKAENRHIKKKNLKSRVHVIIPPFPKPHSSKISFVDISIFC